MHKIKYIFICLALWQLVLIFQSSCSSDQDQSTKVYRNHSDSATYVGGEACKVCHSDKYDSFSETGMGLSFARATEKKSSADFHQFKPVYDSSNNMFYVARFENKILYIVEYRLEGRDTVHVIKQPIDYIIGSGHHTNSHLFQVNGYTYQAPLTFYTQTGQWDLPPGFEKGKNTRFSRIIGNECLACHNSFPKYVEGSENKFTQIPEGISCERCHGPGSIHIAEKKSGKIVDISKQIDYTIVNPSKLPWERQVDVCQRCHLQGNAVLHEDKSWDSFRPGMKLSDYIDVYAPSYEGGNQIIMASHAQRLQESKCFISSASQSTAKLTCITCHNPHVSVKKTGTSQFNNSCGKCHSNEACKETASKRKASQNNCVGCHMPKSGTGDIPHVSVHDHKIGIHTQESNASANPKFIGLQCVNNKKPTDYSWAQAWLNSFEQFGNQQHTLDSASKYIELLRNPQQIVLKVRQLYLKSDYNQIHALKIDPYSLKDAWTAYRCGEAEKNLQLYTTAETYLYHAVALAPYNLEFRQKLAAVYILNNKLKEAIQVLDLILKDQPNLSMAWCNRGYIYKLQGDITTSEKYIDKALQLDPDYVSAIENKIDLCLQRKDQAQVRKYAKKLLLLQPNHPIKNHPERYQ